MIGIWGSQVVSQSMAQPDSTNALTWLYVSGDPSGPKPPTSKTHPKTIAAAQHMIIQNYPLTPASLAAITSLFPLAVGLKSISFGTLCFPTPLENAQIDPAVLPQLGQAISQCHALTTIRFSTFSGLTQTS